MDSLKRESIKNRVVHVLYFRYTYHIVHIVFTFYDFTIDAFKTMLTVIKFSIEMKRGL